MISNNYQMFRNLTECNYSYIQLIDFNARFYSPSLGRFIQPDSIIPDLTNSQAWNRYSYVLNSPIKYVDPSGHIPEWECGFSYGGCGTEGEIITNQNSGSGDGGENTDQPGDINEDVDNIENEPVIGQDLAYICWSQWMDNEGYDWRTNAYINCMIYVYDQYQIPLDFTETDPPYQNPLANYEDVTFLLPQAVMEKDIVKTLFLDALALDDEYTLNFEAVYFAALVYANQDLYNKYNDMYGIQEGTVSGEQSFEDTIYTLIEHWMPLAGGGE